MGKLLLRMATAALLALGLLWAWHAKSASAVRVRALAKRYIAENIVTPPKAQAPKKPATQAGATATPLRWPLSGRVSPAPNEGIDIAAPSGALVRAAASGKVQAVSSDAPGVDVTILSGSLTLTYGHLGPSFVRTGETVRAGQVIGEVPHFAPGQTSALRLTARQGGSAAALPGLLGAP